MKLISSIVCTALVATFSLIWIPAALGKQQCSASVPSNAHGYWSWRLIDGRKCWYEGKPLLSKLSLEWPGLASEQLDSNEIGSAPTEKSSNPLDAQARAPTDLITFDALWRARVDQR